MHSLSKINLSSSTFSVYTTGPKSAKMAPPIQMPDNKWKYLIQTIAEQVLSYFCFFFVQENIRKHTRTVNNWENIWRVSISLSWEEWLKREADVQLIITQTNMYFYWNKYYYISTLKNPGALKMTTLFRGSVKSWKHSGTWSQLGSRWKGSFSMSIY